MFDNHITLAERKAITLDILKSIDVFCKANNISYTIDSGTLIGAIRHSGFIPWDDDIDILMTRENYHRFIENFNEKKCTTQYKCLAFEHGTFYLPFAKVVDLRTKVCTKDFIELEQNGIGVDIFVFDYFADTFEETMEMKRKIIKKKKYLLYPIFREAPSTDFVHYAFWKIFRKIGRIRLAKWYEKKTIKTLPLEKKAYGGSVYFEDNVCLSMVESASFDETVYVTFEGDQYPAPMGYDRYLRDIYGDYMQLPPEDQRNPHSEEATYLDETFAKTTRKKLADRDKD